MFIPQNVERRSKPRMECSFPAIVQGRDAEGRKFRKNAILVNLSTTGMCIVMKSEVEPSKDLFIIFRCSSTGPIGNDKAPLIAIGGDITRSDGLVQGMHTIGVKIRRNRFL